MKYPTRPRPEWMAWMREGDVLKSGAGAYRVVRNVVRKKRHIYVTFTIKRRSWTGRAYTVVNASDLLTFGYTHTGVRLKLDTEMDARIANVVDGAERPGYYTLTPEDVRGVA